LQQPLGFGGQGKVLVDGHLDHPVHVRLVSFHLQAQNVVAVGSERIAAPIHGNHVEQLGLALSQRQHLSRRAIIAHQRIARAYVLHHLDGPICHENGRVFAMAFAHAESMVQHNAPIGTVSLHVIFDEALVDEQSIVVALRCCCCCCCCCCWKLAADGACAGWHR
jgi:hypothetical protein